MISWRDDSFQYWIYIFVAEINELIKWLSNRSIIFIPETCKYLEASAFFN